MKFTDSVAFAAIMALHDQLEEEKQNRIEDERLFEEIYNSYDNVQDSNSNETYDSNDAINKMVDNSVDYLNNLPVRLKQLIEKTQNYMDVSDKIANIETDIPASDLISYITCGVIAETINNADTSNNNKINIYNYAINKCSLNTDATGEYVFADNGEFLNVIKTLSDNQFQLLFTMADVTGRYNEISKLIVELTDFMNTVEEIIKQQFPNFVFNTRPSLFTLNIIISFYNDRMQEMEEKDPTLKQDKKDDSHLEIQNLIENAKIAKDSNDFLSSAQYYKKVLELDNQNWEALFYSEFYTIYVSLPNEVKPASIPSNTERICIAAEKSIAASTTSLMPISAIMSEIVNMASQIINLSATFFTATMNMYNKSSNETKYRIDKDIRVQSIMKMLFSFGDIVEKYYGNNTELCSAAVFSCWSIAFTCYEHATTTAPIGTCDHYQKMFKYDPNFKCSRPINNESDITENDRYVINNKNVATNESSNISSSSNTNSSNNSEGCYIATCIYGNYDCPEVWTLRRFRDQILRCHWYGRKFIQIYYSISPKLVKRFGNKKWFHDIFKLPLDSFVKNLQKQGIKSTVYKDSI